MPRLRSVFPRKIGPVGLALTAFDIWRRIPRQHRRRILAEARKQGLVLAKVALARHQQRRRRSR